MNLKQLLNLAKSYRNKPYVLMMLILDFAGGKKPQKFKVNIIF